MAAANRLRRGLDRRHKVILVNRDPDFTFAASYLWVMTRRRRPAQVTRPLHQLGRRGIDVVIGDVEHINPATRILTVAGRKLTASHLVVALASYQRSDLALPQMAPAQRPGAQSEFQDARALLRR